MKKFNVVLTVEDGVSAAYVNELYVGEYDTRRAAIAEFKRSGDRLQKLKDEQIKFVAEQQAIMDAKAVAADAAYRENKFNQARLWAENFRKNGDAEGVKIAEKEMRLYA
jgi:hypothetical protein